MNLKIAILRLLAGNHGIAETRESLCNGVRVGARQAVTTADFDLALKECETKGWAVGTYSELIGDTRWLITDAGKLALANV